MKLLQLSQAENLFDAAASGTGDSTAFALPARATQITWQTSFSSAPASITVQIKTSNDGLTYTTVDSSTVVGGESKTFVTSALFIKARINAISGGSGITVSVVPKTGFIGAGDITLDNLIISGDLSVTGSISGGSLIASDIQPTTNYKSVDGTAGATAGPFTVITAITVKNGLVTSLTGS